MAFNNSSLINITGLPEDFISYSNNLIWSLKTMSMIVYSLAFVLGVLGNGLVIWVTGFKMKKTVNTVWFLNLALADFLFTMFLPLSITYVATDFHWPFGKFMCKLNSTLVNLNMFASVYILVMISMDRCVSVVLPIWAQNHRSVRKASCLSLAVWVLALILSIPHFVFRDTAQSNVRKDIKCFNNYGLSDDYETPSAQQLRLLRYQAMTITRFLLGFLVPFTFIVSCYAIIIHRLRRHRTLPNQSNRPFKIITAVITTFFLCWAPYHIFALLEMAAYTSHTPNLKLYYIVYVGTPITSSMAFVNSCLNPLVYVFISQNFKDAVHRSIVKVLENAFQESSGSNNHSKSTNIVQSE